MNGQGYQLVIECQLDDGSMKRLYLDTCTEKRVVASAQLASQPVQDGRVISDHMYSNPDEFSISGSFSLYGNIHDDYDDFPEIGASTDRLTNIQKVFEYIKDNGLLCNLTTINTDLDGSVRFKIRESMALKSITWTEKQASMSYALSFVEVLTVDLQEEYVEQDEDLPATTLPEARSLGSILIDENNENGDFITKAIIKALYDKGYISKKDGQFFYETKEFFKNTGKVMLSAIIGEAIGELIVTGIVAGAFALSAIFGGSIAASTIFPVGTIIGAGIGLIAGIVSAIIGIKNIHDQKEKERKILHLVDNIDAYATTLSDGSVKLDIAGAKANCKINNEQIAILTKIFVNVKTEILKMNDDCKVYSISQSEDDNNDREVLLEIEGKPYYITFTKNKEAVNGWDFNVCAANQYFQAVPLDGTNGILYDRNAVVSDLDTADINSNCMFCDASGENFVFIYNPNLSETYNNSQEAQDSVKTKLFGYQVLVSKGQPKDHIEAIYNAIYNKIKELGYV